MSLVFMTLAALVLCPSVHGAELGLDSGFDTHGPLINRGRSLSLTIEENPGDFEEYDSLDIGKSFDTMGECNSGCARSCEIHLGGEDNVCQKRVTCRDIECLEQNGGDKPCIGEGAPPNDCCKGAFQDVCTVNGMRGLLGKNRKNKGNRRNGGGDGGEKGKRGGKSDGEGKRKRGGKSDGEEKRKRGGKSDGEGKRKRGGKSDGEAKRKRGGKKGGKGSGDKGDKGGKGRRKKCIREGTCEDPKTAREPPIEVPPLDPPEAAPPLDPPEAPTCVKEGRCSDSRCPLCKDDFVIRRCKCFRRKSGG